VLRAIMHIGAAAVSLAAGPRLVSRRREDVGRKRDEVIDLSQFFYSYREAVSFRPTGLRVVRGIARTGWPLPLFQLPRLQAIPLPIPSNHVALRRMAGPYIGS
jgi:hypothetical protein